MQVLLSLFAVVFALFWLTVWVAGLYSMGQWLARRLRLRIEPKPAAICFALVGAIFASPVFHYVPDKILGSTMAFCVWLMIAHPLFMGYWIGYKAGREQDEQEWHSNVDAWLADWEDEDTPIWQDWEE